MLSKAANYLQKSSCIKHLRASNSEDYLLNIVNALPRDRGDGIPVDLRQTVMEIDDCHIVKSPKNF